MKSISSMIQNKIHRIACWLDNKSLPWFFPIYHRHLVAMTEITFHYIEIVYLYFSPPVLDQLQYKFLRLLEWYKRKMAMIGLPKLEQLFHGLLESPTISLSPCYCNSGHKFRFNKFLVILNVYCLTFTYLLNCQHQFLFLYHMLHS